jgi:tetratricopeptide (TPR) repeat protein
MNRNNPWMTGIACAAVVLALISLGLNISIWRAESAYRDGTIKLRSGSDDEAKADFDEAIRSKWPQPMFFAASALAQTLRDEHLALPSQPWKAFAVLPETEQEELRQAIVDAHKALELSPNDACFWSNWAWLNALLGNDDSAQIGFEHAIGVDPQDIDGRIGLGLLMERRHLPGAAMEQYAHAIATAPRLLNSLFFRDLKNRWPNDTVNVVNHALVILRTDPTPSPIKLAAIARLDAEQGSTSKAIKEYDVVLSQVADLPYTWDNLGIAELSIDQQRADREFARAAALDSVDIIATNELASIYLDRGDTERARAFYNQALHAPLISVHAERIWRIYHVPSVMSDDVLPTGFLDYISPQLRYLPICDEQTLWSTDESSLSPAAQSRLNGQRDYCASLSRTQVAPMGQ